MKVKTSELNGPALDWAVALATDEIAFISNGNPDKPGKPKCYYTKQNWDKAKPFSPSTDWSRCGPLIEQFNIDLYNFPEHHGFEKLVSARVINSDSTPRDWIQGPDVKIATCRAVVASVLGDEIELPAELFRQEPEKP